MPEFGNAQALYFGGDMEAAIPLSGQVAGRIETIKPVADILNETRDDFFKILDTLHQQYL
jgi:enoyl-[acyl-carrier protein] reductase II